MANDELNDLIYLFIDGEASDSEKSLLLGSMVNDSSLREEFIEAVRLSRIVSVEKNTATPPLALTSSLFSRAGIPFEMAGQTETATENIETLTPKSQASKPLFRKLLSNRLLNNLFFFIVGVGLTVIFIDKYGKNTDFGNKQLSTIFSRPIAENGGGRLLPEATDKVRAENAGSRNNQNRNSSGPSVRYIYRNVPVQLVHDFNSVRASQSVASQSVNSGNGTYRNDELSTNMPIDKTEIKQDEKTIITTDLDATRLPAILTVPENPARLPENPARLPEKIAMEVNGIGSLAYFPDRKLISASEPDINNLAVNIAWLFDGNHSAGVEYGVESYPMFLREADDSYTPVNSMEYCGVFYQYSLEPINFYGKIVPDVRLLAGWTKIGPVIKESAGLTFFPETMVGFSVGVESSGIITQYLGKVKYTGKLGFYYGINIKF